MRTQYAHLGSFSDLVTVAGRRGRLFPIARPGLATQSAVRKALAFEPYAPKARQVRVERQWERDGIAGQVISWSVGYGPRTEAWLLRPSGVRHRLPGVVALHDHGGAKFLGKEKIASGPTAPTKLQRDWMNRIYGGRPFADELARLGFCVLVP